MPKKIKKIKSKSITSFVVSEKEEENSDTELKSQLRTEEQKSNKKNKEEENNSDIKIDENILENIDENEKKSKTEKNASNQKFEKDKPIKKLNNINLDKYLDKFQKISLKDKIFFTKNLSVMLKAGLSLGKAMQALSEQTANKKFQKTLKKINEKIKQGCSFAVSLKEYPKVFNNLFVSMIEAGEISGNLENVLEQLHKQMKRDHELISRVRGAMIYPIIVITAMVGIGIGMIVFVIPKFMSIFEEVGADLPFTTRVLMNISNFVSQNGLMVLLSAIVLTVFFIQFFKTKKGKQFLHKSFLTLPILSPIVKKINLARFSRTLSSLLNTDIPIVDAFQITGKVLNNLYYKQALNETSEKIKKGDLISESLEKYKTLFPAVTLQMIKVGEESGSLDSILEELANFYEDEVSQIMKNLPTIIEPVLMLILGAGVGFMAVAVLMPMYSLGQAM